MSDENNLNPNPPPSGGSPAGDQPNTPQGEGDQPGKRSAEARIDQLIAINKELTEDLRKVKERVDTIPVPTPPRAPESPQVTPDVEQAVKYVKKVGKFVDEDDINTRFQSLENRMVLNNEHQRLESRYNGQDGGPKYSRSEVETYMNKNGVFNPEVAYKQLYDDELFDLRLKKMEKDRSKKPFIPRPTSTEGERTNTMITKERIDEVMKNPTPENKAWYEQNRRTILKMMADGQLSN